MAEITGGELKYVATLDTSQLDKGLTDGEGKLKGFSEIAELAGEKLDNALKGNILENLKKIGLQSNLTGKELQDALKGADDYLKGMEIGLKEAIKLNQQFAKEISVIGDGPERDAMVKEWEAINTEIEDAAISIEALKKYVADVKYESAPLQTQFNRAKEEMEQLVYLGEKGSPKYQKLSEEAGRLKKAMADVADELKIVTDPTGMQGFISLLTTAAGITSTAAGVYGLFGKKSEEIAAITDKINSIMAVAVGLQGVASQGMQAYTTVTNFFSVAQGRLAVALGITNGAARVLLGTFSLGLAIIIPVLIGYFSNLIEKQKEAAKTQNLLSEAMREGAGNAAKEVTQLEVLYRTATNTNLAMEQRVAAVKKLQNEYPRHFGNLKQEIILTGQAGNAYRKLAQDIISASQARAIQSKMDVENEKFLQTREDYIRRIADAQTKIKNAKGYSTTMGSGQGTTTIFVSAAEAKKAAETEFNMIVREYQKVYGSNKQMNDRMVKEIMKKSKDSYVLDLPNVKIPTVKTPVTKNNSGAGNTPPVEEIFLPGSLADLRKKLSEVEEAFSKTNNEVTRDTLNQQKIILEGQIKAIEDRYKVVEKTQTEEEKALEQFIQAHRTFEQQKTDITAKYNKIREGIDGSNISDSEKTRLKAAASEEEGKEISEAFLKGLKDNPEWVEAFGKIENYTLEKLRKLRQMLVDQLSKMQSNGAAASDIKAVQEQIQKMDGLINKTSNPFELIRKGIRDFGDESLTTEEKIESLNNALAAFRNTSELVKQIVGDIEDVFISLGGESDSAFGDILQNLEQTIAGLEQFAEGAAQALEGFAKGNMLQAAAGAIKAVAGAVKAISGWINGDNKKERDIKRQAKLLNELKTAYDELAFAAERAFGSQKYSGQRDLIRNLEQQKAVIQSMMSSEIAKKKTDQSKVNDYKNQLQSISQSIITIREGIVKDVLQTDVVDAAQKVGDALVENFGRGEDAVKSLEKTADDVIKNLLRNQLNLALQNRMKPVLDQLLAASGFNADGTGTFTGLTPEQIANFKSQVTAAGLSMQSFLEGYKEIFGVLNPTNLQGVKGDIKGVTEKTAGALEAQINAMRMNQVENLNVTRNILLNIILIEVNTRRLHNIDKNIAELNSKVTKPLAGL